jgi:hypothetical protein
MKQIVVIALAMSVAAAQAQVVTQQAAPVQPVQLVLGESSTTEYARTNNAIAEANRKAAVEAFKLHRSDANRAWVHNANAVAKSWREFYDTCRRAEKVTMRAAKAAQAAERVTPPEVMASAAAQPPTNAPSVSDPPSAK